MLLIGCKINTSDFIKNNLPWCLYIHCNIYNGSAGNLLGHISRNWISCTILIDITYKLTMKHEIAMQQVSKKRMEGGTVNNYLIKRVILSTFQNLTKLSLVLIWEGRSEQFFKHYVRLTILFL